MDGRRREGRGWLSAEEWGGRGGMDGVRCMVDEGEGGRMEDGAQWRGGRGHGGGLEDRAKGAADRAGEGD